MFKKVFIAVIIGFVLFLIGLGVYENMQGIYSADGKSSALTKLHYDVTILPDGSSRVDEYRTYRFIKGTFSRGFLEIQGRIADVVVSEQDQPYSKLKTFSNNRPPGNYAVNEKSLPARIEWYFLAKNKDTRTFKVSYTVKSTAVLYNDCVDYFHKYLSSKNVYKIKEFTTAIHLPVGANVENTKIWAHGPAGGSVEFKDDNTVQLSMKNVPSGRFIEARLVFSPEVLPKCDKKVNANMYKELVERENSAAAKSDKERLRSGIFTGIGFLIAGLLLLLPLAARFIYLRGVKRPTPQFAPDYYRELPSNIAPAELDCLINHLSGKENTARQMSATILDLIYRGVLKARSIEESGILRNKKDTELVLNTSLDNKLARHEKTLVDFLFAWVGEGGNKVTLSRVEEYCSHKATARQASVFYNDFSGKVLSMAGARGYFESEKNELPRRMGLLLPFYILMMIGPMVLASQAGKMFNSLLQIIAVGGVLGFFIFISLGPKKKRMLTQKGEDEFALWLAFKKFLTDFTAFEEKELPELFIWEKYLVYATVLEVADKLLKQIFIRYPELAGEYNSRLLCVMDMHNLRDATSSLDRIGDSIGRAVRSAANISARSSQGSGGGFSAGGSDAGGGSGGSSGGVD